MAAGGVEDAHATALASACASGALAKCDNIYLSENPASQAARQKVADAIKNRKKWAHLD